MKLGMLLIGAIILMTVGGTELPLKGEVYLPFEYLDGDSKLPGGTYTGAASGNVSMVPGVLGNGVFISGKATSCVYLGDERNSCFWSPEFCTQGYTVAMWVNLMGEIFGTPVFFINNGGHTAESYGTSIHLSKQSGTYVLNYNMKTKSRKYKISCTPFIAGTWVHLAFVWSLETGGVGYMDGERCANDTAWTSAILETTDYNSFYLGKPTTSTTRAGGDVWQDELLFWSEQKDDDFISSLYDMYQETNVLGARKMTAKKVNLKSVSNKKLVDDVGQVVTVESRLDCIRRCFLADVMCLVAEWREAGQICKLANVVPDNAITADAAGVMIYEKFHTFP